METTIEERQQLEQINRERMEAMPEKDSISKSESDSHPDYIALIIFLPLAIIADLLGALDLTIFLSIVVRIVNIPILGALWLWRISKQGVGKSYIYQLLLAFLIEASPFGIIPTWTTFVLYVYFKDTSIGKKTIGKVEKLSKSKK